MKENCELIYNNLLDGPFVINKNILFTHYNL